MKIRFLPTFPLSIAYGGQEVVQSVLVENLCKQKPDWDISILDYSLHESIPDLYHLVGNSASLSSIVKYIPKEVPVVISVIDGVRDDSPIKRMLKKALHVAANCFQEDTTFGQLNYLFQRANKILPLNSRAAAFAISRYRIPSNRVEVLPNGASPLFFERPESNEPGVLISGSLIRRKCTQEAIDFAKSSFGAAFKFHFVGGLQNNELNYGNECLARINAAHNCHYHGFVPQQSDQFWRIFDGCRYFLQLSSEETQSLSALEAIAGGKRCVFRRAAYSTESPFDLFPNVTSMNAKEILSAIQIAESNKVDRTVVYSWPEITQRLIKIYEETIA